VTDLADIAAPLRRVAWADALGRQLAAERERWVLWLPVAFGCGVAWYFLLTTEPPLALGPALVALFASLAYLSRRSTPLFWAILPFVFAAAGFTASELRTRIMAGPLIASPTGITTVSGRVIEIDLTRAGRRVLLDHAWIAGVPHEDTPDGLRLNASAQVASGLKVGEWIRARALVSPIPPPAIPGGFDYQRFLYFNGFASGYGGIGKILTAPREMTPPRSYHDDWLIRIARARTDLTVRVMAVLPGDTGAVSAALIAGDQTAISDRVMQDMRDSGLAHILSISGLHIGLVAAFLLGLVRGGLALAPYVALRYPIKKWAALGALVAVFFYCLLAGLNNVPVVRSLLMSAFGLFAVLIDRKPVSLHVVAWTALACMALTPDGLLGPSFQMSFGAVIALIAAGEMSAPYVAEWRRDAGIGRKIALAFGLMIFTSLVATLATSPASIFIFNRIAVYGVLANMIAIPLSSLIIMPAGILAVALMPFGLERIGLAPMGWGVDLLDRAAAITAHLPGAVVKVPEMPVSALAALSLGGLWICIWRQRWRWWGIAPILAGVALTAMARSPDILVSPNGKLVGLNTAEHGLLVSRSSRLSMERDSWLARLATEPGGDFASASDEQPGLDCDRAGCLYEARGQTIGWVKRIEASAELCGKATIVISALTLPASCTQPQLVIDRASLARTGSLALWLDPTGVRTLTDRERRGVRPWSPLAPTDSAASSRSAGPAP
jgi:competence protein ComEC